MNANYYVIDNCRMPFIGGPMGDLYAYKIHQT